MTGPPPRADADDGIDDHGTLSTPEVEAWTGITFRRIDAWLHLGLIPGPASIGAGRPRRWTPDQVRHLQLVGRLVDAGLSPAVASRVAALGPGAHEIAPDITVEIGP